jgi:DNA-binding transcriptional LysR family regulator
MESLRGMVSFVQTARLGSFVKAAAALEVSAVAVSRNVARLEAQLGVRLFARTTRQLSLTDEGQTLLAQCEAPLEQLENAFRRSRASSDEPTGRVRVTAVSPFARSYLMPQLGAFHARYPKVELDVELSEQVTDLVADQFDVGIRVGPLRDASFIARPLGPVAMVLCASPAYLAKHDAPQKLADLATHKRLVLKLGASNNILSWWFQSAKGVVEHVPEGPLRCNDFAALSEACCGGLGLAQLPLVVALPALRVGRLRVLLPDSVPKNLRLFMYYPDRQLPARVRVFVDFVMEVLQKHPDLDVSAHEFAFDAEKKGFTTETQRTQRARGGKRK